MSKPKKYPVGTRIRYIGRNDGDYWRKGWVGEIVGLCPQGFPLIHLPDSPHISSYKVPGKRVTVQTSWESIEPIAQLNEQLEFSFMEKD